MSEEKKNGLLDTVLGAVKLDWIRPLIYKVGGRKMVATGGGLLVIERIVALGGESLGWPHAIACLAVSITVGAMAFATASEDKTKVREGK